MSLGDSRRDAVPAKIYEYLVYPGTTLVVTEADSATARLLAHLPLELVRAGDEESVCRALERSWEEYRSGVRRPPLRPAGLSRRRQSKVLLDWLGSREPLPGSPARAAPRRPRRQPN